MNLRPRVKICCIKSPEEARLAIAHGASALGLVSAMPSGPGVVDEETIARIAVTVPPPIATFLLTSLREAEAIIAQQRRCRTNTLQLCDYVELPVYAKLRVALAGIALVQVIHVTGEESVALAQKIAPHVDAILLDSGNTSLAVKELGGTGRVHDWRLSRRIRDAVTKPLFLAGGLRAAMCRKPSRPCSRSVLICAAACGRMMFWINRSSRRFSRRWRKRWRCGHRLMGQTKNNRGPDRRHLLSTSSLLKHARA